MSGTRFINPNGLPGAGQQTTARDMALLAYAMMREFPEHSLLWRMPAIRYGNRVMRNPNHLIGRYQGADGFKTGFTCASGFNVVATATRGGRKLIVVVLGATSARGRAETAAGLFERHFVSGGSGVGLSGIANDLTSGPPNIRDQACRRRGRGGPVYIEAGEELDNEPVAAATDPGNLTYAQMMAASQQRQGRRGGRQAGVFAAMPGAVVSHLGPYRPTMDPVPVFIGGAGPAATPAPALAAASSTAVTLPASAPVATTPPVAAPPAPGAIQRGAAPAAAPVTAARHGAIGAPMSLQGALPPDRPASAPPRTPVPTATPAPRPTRAAATTPSRQPPRRAQQRPRR
jgi:D-alanyl-D-alanine carboxypeptidase